MSDDNLASPLIVLALAIVHVYAGTTSALRHRWQSRTEPCMNILRHELPDTDRSADVAAVNANHNLWAARGGTY